MKRACLVVLIGWLVPTPAFASPCVPGSLASYIALGGGGCNIGDEQFFNFVDLPLQGGAFAIPDSNVLVNPVTAGNPGFRFNVNSQAQAGDILERVIGFSLSGLGFIGSQLTLTGSNVATDGAITVLENECLGAAFGPGQFCSSIDAQLSGFDLGPFLGQSLNDSSSFGSTSLLGVIVDITVDGGTDGSAGLASATTQFTPVTQATPVPEPATLTLLAFGLAAGIRRRQSPRASASSDR
jgi:PEP-CTERM motif-containing protein